MSVSGSPLGREIRRIAAEVVRDVAGDGESQLPTFPAAGSRDNKVPKFSGDTLGWEVDSGDVGGATDQTARDAAAAAQLTADAALPKAGGTMTGKVVLDGAPTQDLHAASKKYVDDNAGSAYTLPQATEGTRGGVQGATAAQATAIGTTILAWTSTRLRALVAAALPTVSGTDAAAGTSAARRAWTAARVRQAINAVVPAVFRAGNTTRISTAKLGSGTASAASFLRGDGAWAAPPTTGDGSGNDATARTAAAAAQATADAALPKAGGTMTGQIVTAGAPTADLHAANKKYVDDNAGGGPVASSGNPRLDRVNETALAVSGTSTQGPLIADLGDLFLMELSYTRATNPVRMWTPMWKGILSAIPYPLQLQGSGGAHLDLTSDGMNLSFGDAADATGITAISVVFWNVIGAPDGVVRLTKAGNTVSVSSAASTGPALSGIGDFFKLRFQYDRSPDTDIVMWSDMRKAELAAGLDLQMQGAGSAHVGIGTDASDNIEFDNTGAGAVTNIEVEVFNVAASGDKGDPGGGGATLATASSSTGAVTETGAGSQGTATTAARKDHTHQLSQAVRTKLGRIPSSGGTANQAWKKGPNNEVAGWRDDPAFDHAVLTDAAFGALATKVAGRFYFTT